MIHATRKTLTSDSAAVATNFSAGSSESRVVNGHDKLCGAAADMFASLYGAEAGNCALKFLSTGGMYVGGGIAPKLLPVLQRGSFMKAFVAKGRFEELLKNVPVMVALNDKAPLIGAARFAADAL